MAEPVLSLRNFGVAFRERVVLRSVDLDVPAQGASVIVGPVAGGKSTLLRAIAGLLAVRPETRISGAVLYGGRPLSETPAEQGPALVAQKARLMTASVLENLVCYLPDRSRLTLAEQRVIAGRMVAEARLPELVGRLDQSVVELPIGWQRRLAIVRTAASDPALLCVDEPTAELPDDEADVILDLLARYSRRRAVLVVTHNQTHAQFLGGRTSLIVGGMVVEHGPTDAFFTAPRTQAGRQFVRTGSCSDSSMDIDLQTADLSEETSPTSSETVGAAANSDVPRFVESVVDPPAKQQSTRSGSEPDDARPNTADPAVGSSVEVNPAAVADAIISDPRSRDAVAAPTRPKRSPRGLGPRGFVWLWPERLAGTPRPGLVRDLDGDLALLTDLGVTTLVCLTDETPPVEEAALRRHGLTCLTLPIRDMGAPSVEDAWRLCERIRDLLAVGHVVAVHCRAGLGRTGSILAAQLIFQEGRTALEALEMVRRPEPRWVQSPGQIDFLVRFAAFVRNRREGTPPAVGAGDNTRFRDAGRSGEPTRGDA
ncbi:MAG TPA: ATP-binding cassette domain-containing protein [Pirellulales bacterium]